MTTVARGSVPGSADPVVSRGTWGSAAFTTRTPTPRPSVASAEFATEQGLAPTWPREQTSKVTAPQRLPRPAGEMGTATEPVPVGSGRAGLNAPRRPAWARPYITQASATAREVALTSARRRAATLTCATARARHAWPIAAPMRIARPVTTARPTTSATKITPPAIPAPKKATAPMGCTAKTACAVLLARCAVPARARPLTVECADSATLTPIVRTRAPARTPAGTALRMTA